MSEVFLYGTGGGGKGEDLEEVLTEQEELIERLKEALENKIAASNTHIVPLIVTKNGIYTAPEGQAYSPVEVNVAGSGGDNVANSIIDRTISGDFTYSGTNVGDYVFYLCKNLENVNLPNATILGEYAFAYSGMSTIIAPKVYLFGNCALYQAEALESAHMPLVVQIGYSGFAYCRQLKSVDLPKVTTTGTSVFSYCSALTHVNLPLLTSVENNALEYCESLTSLYLPSAESIGNSSIRQCKQLKSVDLPKVTTIGTYAFGACSALTDVDLPLVPSIERSAFERCESLTRLDFPCVTSLSTSAFDSCYILKTLILRSSTICTMANTNVLRNCYHFTGTVNSTHNPQGLKDGYIYVPKVLIEDYKVATNWSTFATQFRAIEDYPEICGEV